MTLSGTTSACAENTHPAAASRRLAWNYLRVRGEYLSPCHQYIHLAELPPRARRIRDNMTDEQYAEGTTSACAENTRPRRMGHAARRNYLRVRGEYQPLPLPARPAAELPPRARRIRRSAVLSFWRSGTTSACAENTNHSPSRRGRRRNYLRVRGEYQKPSPWQLSALELPPRARRILTGGFGFLGFEGTTSACAENTSFPRLQQRLCKNYLRVRGEYTWGATESCDQAELPPRARRIRQIHDQGVGGEGTTSACAENTRHHGLTPPHPWNYLRVRGEY